MDNTYQNLLKMDAAPIAQIVGVYGYDNMFQFLSNANRKAEQYANPKELRELVKSMKNKLRKHRRANIDTIMKEWLLSTFFKTFAIAVNEGVGTYMAQSFRELNPWRKITLEGQHLTKRNAIVTLQDWIKPREDDYVLLTEKKLRHLVGRCSKMETFELNTASMQEAVKTFEEFEANHLDAKTVKVMLFVTSGNDGSPDHSIINLFARLSSRDIPLFLGRRIGENLDNPAIKMAIAYD